MFLIFISELFSGNNKIDIQLLNIKLILISLLNFKFDILGKYDKE